MDAMFVWGTFWKTMLSDEGIFIEFYNKIPKNIFNNCYMTNTMILLQQYGTTYGRMPNFDTVRMLYDNLPEGERENKKYYLEFLDKIEKLEVKVDREAFEDWMVKELQTNELTGFILSIANRIGSVDAEKLSGEFHTEIDKLNALGKNDSNNLDRAFLLTVKQAIERQNRDLAKVNPNKLCKYSVKCLNDTLIGILPSELVVVGADTGIGKTQIANDTAKVNAMAKRKVCLFSLEGDKNEIISRYKYEIIAREYFKNPTGIPMSYLLYITNSLKGIEKMETRAEEELMQMDGYLRIYGKREHSLTIDTLVQQLERIKDAELIIIDHLHYFSLFDETSEAQQLADIMRQIKDLTEQRGIPVVLISHLRRKTKDRKVPTNDDFHGSSSIAKHATTTILFTPHFEEKPTTGCPTIISIGKSRNGVRTDIGFRDIFDLNLRKYEDQYELVKIRPYSNPEVIPTEDCPKSMLDAMGVSDSLKRMDSCMELIKNKKR